MADQQIRFTPDELKALVDGGAELSYEDIQKMDPRDQKVLGRLMDQTINPETGKPRDPVAFSDMSTPQKMGTAATLAGGAALGGAAVGLPAAVAGASLPLSGIPGSVKAGVGGYLGWEGARHLGDALGLPGPLKEILALATAHHFGGFGKAGPAAAAEAEAPLTGRTGKGQTPFEIGKGSRDILANGRPTRSATNLTSPKEAIRQGQGDAPVTGGVDVESLDYPPNVTRRKPGSGASFGQQPTPNWEDSRNTRAQDQVDPSEVERVQAFLRDALNKKRKAGR